MLKAPLKAPNSHGPIEDWAFSMYAMDFEERRSRRQRALVYLTDHPEEVDEVQWMFDLDENDMEMIRMGVC